MSGSEYIQTVTPHWHYDCKNIALSVLAILPCFALSLVRSFPLLSKLALLAGLCTFVGLITLCSLLAQQSGPQGDGPYRGEPIISATPAQGSSFVEFMVAFLTIGFGANASVTIPTLVSDMEDPRYVLHLNSLCI